MKKTSKTAVLVVAGLLSQGKEAWSQMAETVAQNNVSSTTLPLPELDQEQIPSQPPEETLGKTLTIRAAGAKEGVSALVESFNAEPIDFNFKDADLLGILRTFANKFNKNIIAAPGVGGRVNMQLRKVPFDEAFRTLLDQMGLVAIQKSAHVIEVIKAAEMPVLVEVFPLKYRFALEVQATLVSMLRDKDKTGTIVAVDLASNSLIVTSTNDILHKMKLMIRQLDIPAPQISVKARLIEVQAGNAINWGITWNGSAPLDNGTVRGIKDMGNFTTDPLTGAIKSLQTPTLFPLGGILDVSTVLGKTKLYALLNLIKSDSHTKTISEPMVLTGNNKSAKIHVGQNLPVKIVQVTPSGTTQSVQFIQEGVDLEVTPIVSPGSDVISFKIRVGVSEFVGFQSDNPITTERVATTEVSIESGMTVVIGGLMKDKTLDSVSGIPLLKDIPLLGYLFKNKKKSTEKTELLIFITPELVNRS